MSCSFELSLFHSAYEPKLSFLRTLLLYLTRLGAGLPQGRDQMGGKVVRLLQLI
jgi:hypothetical protein